MKAILVGAGYWGTIVKKYIQNSPHFELTGVYSRSRFALTVEEFIESADADVVFICTPKNTHYQIARYALLHHKHIFCEKPLTGDLHLDLELYKIAEKNKVQLFVDYIYAYSASIHRLKQLLPEVSRVAAVHMEMAQYGKFYPDTDVMGNIGVHMLTVLGMLFGYDSDISHVNTFAVLSDKNGKVINGVYQFFIKNIPVSLALSLVNPVKIRRIFIAGEYGSIQCDMLDEKNIRLQKYDPHSFASDQTGCIEESYDERNNLEKVMEAFAQQLLTQTAENKTITLFVEKTSQKLDKCLSFQDVSMD